MIKESTFTENLLKRSYTQSIAIINATAEYFDILLTIPELAYEPIIVLTSSTFEIYFNLTNKNGFFYCGILGIEQDKSAST